MAIETQIDTKTLPFLSLTDFLYAELPNYDGSRVPLVITTEMIQRYGGNLEDHPNIKTWDLVDAFLTAILGDAYDDDHPIHKNFALATYENDLLSFFGRPIIVKYNDQIQLIMGSESKDSGLSYTAIPLVFSPTGITLQGSKIQVLGIEAIEIPDPKAVNSRIKIPVAIFNVFVDGLKFVMAISIRTAKDVQYHDFKDAWNSKDIEALNSMVGNLYGASCSISYMFKEYFKGGTFPKQGIVLKLTGAKVNTTEKEGKQLKSVLFTVDTSGLPAIKVTSTGEKNTEQVPLNEVTGIFANYESHNVSKPLLSGNKPTPENPWYLYIMGKGRSDSEVPQHQVYTSVVPNRVKAIVQQMQQPTYFLPSSVNYDDRPF